MTRASSGDRRALDPHAVLLDGVRRIDRDLVVGGVAVLDAQVVVVEIDVEVREDQHVLDELPDDASHLVAIEIYDRTFDFDLGHVSPNPPRATNALRAAVMSMLRKSLARPDYKGDLVVSGRADGAHSY